MVKNKIITFRNLLFFLTAITTIVAMILAILNNKLTREIELKRNQEKLQLLRMSNDNLKIQLERIDEEYRKQRDKIGLYATILNDTSSEDAKSFERQTNIRLSELQYKFDSLKNSHQDLKTSLKPTKIEDILSIPRLQDEVRILNQNLERLESDLNRQQRSFEASIRAETDSSGRSTNLILVVLIPLVMNFLYTVWKDRKDNNLKDKE